jgi:hypothetical protein
MRRTLVIVAALLPLGGCGGGCIDSYPGDRERCGSAAAALLTGRYQVAFEKLISGNRKPSATVNNRAGTVGTT